MTITSCDLLQYQLETFTEGRKTAWEYEPYSGSLSSPVWLVVYVVHCLVAGQVVDGPLNGPAPQPWSISAHPGQLFHDHEKHFEVPHTASVKPCHNCTGSGFTRCWRCHGSTRVRITGNAIEMLYSNNNNRVMIKEILAFTITVC